VDGGEGGRDGEGEIIKKSIKLKETPLKYSILKLGFSNFSFLDSKLSANTLMIDI